MNLLWHEIRLASKVIPGLPTVKQKLNASLLATKPKSTTLFEESSLHWSHSEGNKQRSQPQVSTSSCEYQPRHHYRSFSKKVGASPRMPGNTISRQRPMILCHSSEIKGGVRHVSPGEGLPTGECLRQSVIIPSTPSIPYLKQSCGLHPCQCQYAARWPNTSQPGAEGTPQPCPSTVQKDQNG